MIGAKARADTMQRDNGECQFFCGGQPATEIAHFDHQGVGGLPASHWKNQPPNLAASCGECHRLIHSKYAWKEFEATGFGVDHTARRMKILDSDGNEVPESDLWFYNRWRQQAAIMAAQSLQTVAEIDCTIGEMMRDLRDGAEFLEGARSFDEHVSGLGWDPIKANDIADVYEWAVEREGWPSEVNYAKMKLICDSLGTDAELSPEGKQHHGHVCRDVIQSAASGASYSTLRKDLIEAGAVEVQLRTYLVCSPLVLGRGIRAALDVAQTVAPIFVRTRKEDELIAAATERGLAALKINAFKGRLRFKRGKEGGLFDMETGEAIELLSLEEWMA